jgi:hypothetical protein
MLHIYVCIRVSVYENRIILFEKGMRREGNYGSILKK